MLRQISEGIYEVRYGAQLFTVAFLPDTIALYGSVGHQFFKNPRNVKANDLRRIYPTEDHLVEAATMHKAGITNKDKFKASIERLRSHQKISGIQLMNLRSFIESCDCPPLTVKRKLKVMGYPEMLVSKIEFEDQEPELEATLYAMNAFMEEVCPKTNTK